MQSSTPDTRQAGSILGLGTTHPKPSRPSRVYLSAFYDDYPNQQVSTYLYLEPGLPSALTENAGSSTIYGVESQVVYNIPLIGRFDASVDYLHARYNYFLSVADPSDPAATGNVQLAGNTPPQSPTWTFEVGLEHAWEVFNGTL